MRVLRADRYEWGFDGEVLADKLVVFKDGARVLADTKSLRPDTLLEQAIGAPFRTRLDSQSLL